MIGSLSSGTTYFIVITAVDAFGETIARSEQIEAQTTDVIDKPILRVG